MSLNQKAIEISNVYFSYGEEPFLKDFSMEIMKGETFVLVGTNESGKSTVLKLCVGLFKPDRGHVILDGYRVSEMAQKDLLLTRKKIGYVFQNNALFSNMKVYDNIELPLQYHTGLNKIERKERVMNKLAVFNLVKVKDFFPAQLSESKKSLVAIARAVILEPEVLILDEPASMLDPPAFRNVMELLQPFRRNAEVTLLITARSTRGFRVIGDNVGIIKDGKLFFRGSLEELNASKDSYIRSLYF